MSPIFNPIITPALYSLPSKPQVSENDKKYKLGGYHPVMIGDILHRRYRIVDKLGYGGYSTIWLARDAQLEQYVAVKSSTADLPSRETRILRALSSPSEHPGHQPIPLTLDELELHGPNGVHQCYTMAPARCNLQEVSFSRLFPLEVARALAGSLTQAIAYTHSQGSAHGDVHLRNVLVKLPLSFDRLSIEQLYEEYGEPETVNITERNGKPLPRNIAPKAVLPLYLGKDAENFSLSDVRVILSDFGEAFALNEGRPGKDCCTPLPMRPPEARFEPQVALSYSADIWSLAVAIWEILGMKAIFSSEFTTADEMVSNHIDVLGPMPLSWWNAWEERSQFFDDDGHPKEGRHVWLPINEAFEHGAQKYRRKSSRVDEFSREETVVILAGRSTNC
ncbi:hypothetical protein V496_04373 [Pseudogymnoascus sp. VKM F-4515 (FW-2607)]|nr:hypothetical protein V496_04373 [Pseudogymnoascus sp. VKM F-4515 (FW-2607)]KFY99110.1 hypothetical protein V498_01006 [Pseudogymnoascus sp. VKM F-4517 (FW-2822)]